MTVPPPPGGTPPPPPPPPSQPPQPPSAPFAPGVGGSTGQTNTPALISLITGIVSLCFGPLSGIPAIVLGIIGKGKAKELNGNGSTQAIIGIVLGALGTILGIVGIILLATGVIDTRSEAEKIVDRYTDRVERTGDTADSDDYDIYDTDVTVDSYGSVTFTATIENTSGDDDAGYTISVYCEGDLGDEDTQEYTVYSLDDGDTEDFSIDFYTFDYDTESAECSIDDVTYYY